MYKTEFKNYISESIENHLHWFVRDHGSRLDSMCRAIINRSSYDLHCDSQVGSPAIYPEKDGKTIIIEKPNTFLCDGMGHPLYLRIYETAKEIIEKAKKDFVPSEASKEEIQ
jgi:hypothetical protein